jgi:hypothetical protein
MSREKVGFREQIDRLDAKFPGKEAIDLKEATEYLDTDKACLLSDNTFPAKKVGGKYLIFKVRLASWMCSE